MKKEVVGHEMIEAEADKTIKYIYDEIRSCIKPTISSGITFKVFRVPVKDLKTGKYLPGRYVLKLSVRLEDRKRVYTYTDSPEDKKEHFPFRVENGIDTKTRIQEVFGIVKDKREK